MSDFMASVYEQQPMPTNITGVPVTFTVTDQNGNTYNIGTTTTNAYGSYGFNWTPQIPGNYTIVATFAGTGGYYGSCAETYLYANTLAATSAPTATTSVTGLASTNTVELGIATIAIIVIIIGAILAILMLRKRP